MGGLELYSLACNIHLDDIDDQWEMLHSVLLDSLNAFGPLRKASSRRAKRPTPWFTDCIATKIKNHAQ